MIVARLNGQLGNQLFVYATAYALSQEKKDKLAIFKYEYDTVGRSFKYQLDDLKLYDYNRYWGIPFSLYVHTTGEFVKKVFSRVLKTKKSPQNMYKNPCVDVIKEKDNSFQPIFLSGKTKVHVLEGFWQSPFYFEKYREDIVHQFQPDFDLSSSTKKYLQAIAENPYSVSIHIRRGDYVNIGWCISMEYYYRAIDVILKKNPKAVFFVFSDDLEWVKKNLRLEQKQVVYVEHDQRIKPFEDIWLMSKCKSNIIANSSFSWWGAYLNQNQGKTVIAPSAMQRTNNCDAFCPEWIVIESDASDGSIN